MTDKDLLELCRFTIDDNNAPYLWSDTELINARNRALNYFCERTEIIKDSSTMAICRISIAATASKSITVDNTGKTFTRSDGGSFITDNFVNGLQIRTDSLQTKNVGPFLVSLVTASAITVTALDGSAVTLTDETAVFNIGCGQYSIDSRIIKVERAKLDSMTYPLVKVSTNDMDFSILDWEKKFGTPSGYLFDRDAAKLTLYTIPILADVLFLTVRRLPLAQLTMSLLSTSSPEIPFRYHDALVDGIAAFLYLKQDTDNVDLRKYAARKMAFEESISMVHRRILIDEKKMEWNSNIFDT